MGGRQGVRGEVPCRRGLELPGECVVGEFLVGHGAGAVAEDGVDGEFAVVDVEGVGFWGGQAEAFELGPRGQGGGEVDWRGGGWGDGGWGVRGEGCCEEGEEAGGEEEEEDDGVVGGSGDVVLRGHFLQYSWSSARFFFGRNRKCDDEVDIGVYIFPTHATFTTFNLRQVGSGWCVSGREAREKLFANKKAHAGREALIRNGDREAETFIGIVLLCKRIDWYR